MERMRMSILFSLLKLSHDYKFMGRRATFAAKFFSQQSNRWHLRVVRPWEVGEWKKSLPVQHRNILLRVEPSAVVAEKNDWNGNSFIQFSEVQYSYWRYRAPFFLLGGVVLKELWPRDKIHSRNLFSLSFPPSICSSSVARKGVIYILCTEDRPNLIRLQFHLLLPWIEQPDEELLHHVNSVQKHQLNRKVFT